MLDIVRRSEESLNAYSTSSCNRTVDESFKIDDRVVIYFTTEPSVQNMTKLSKETAKEAKEIPVGVVTTYRDGSNEQYHSEMIAIHIR